MAYASSMGRQGGAAISSLEPMKPCPDADTKGRHWFHYSAGNLTRAYWCCRCHYRPRTVKRQHSARYSPCPTLHVELLPCQHPFEAEELFFMLDGAPATSCRLCGETWVE